MTDVTYERGDGIMPVVRVMAHGQVTIPKEIRDTLGLKKGDLAEAELRGDEIVITPKKLVKQSAWARMEALLNEVHERNKDKEFTEEEVASDAEQAVAEYRAEKRARQQKNT